MGISEEEVRELAQTSYSLSDGQLRNMVWQKYANLIEMDEEHGAKTVLIKDSETETGNRPAYEAIFKTFLPKGGITYTVLHIVELEEGKNHLFWLEADVGQYEFRFKDFRGLLKSIYYGPVVVKTAASQTKEKIVTGRRVQWTGRISNNWMGGNAAVIKQAIRDTEDVYKREIYSEMLSDAKGLDVYLVRLNEEYTKLESLPSIRVLERADDSNYSNEIKRKEFWKSYEFIVQFNEGEGSKTVLTTDRVTRTGNHKAYEATFKTIKPQGEIVYEVVHIVRLEGGLCHMFILWSKGNDYEDQIKDFHKLLNSVHYK
jgi:hypothetical protein